MVPNHAMHHNFSTDCDENINVENEIFVNYISLSDLVTQIITPELCFNNIMKNNSPTTLSCPRRESQGAVSGVTIINVTNLFLFSLV